ncbi:BspA family leucine-rich repeat surface protein [Allomuricauda sp. NBRC 101325]|uniref:BspA family leucine-rich repeat surface protein n=1 Tax=Allomuricauda sp. NBRC 101325 TaxID=1113758 RepID=UPI0024A5F0CE|nr:BspA family leucine-rich repeat surface protein [Muricauda sp. NBRC 101325]GLU44491.1 hypothetical protein Musp01_21150 [Muricauda sp. NBRC 101325]
MKKYLALAFVAMALVWSCSKDDDSPAPGKGPHITAFSPPSGAVGSTITITGQNFGATASENSVKIGTATATISSAKTTELVVTVPAGAATGKVSVTVGGQTATGGTFTVTASEPQNLAPVIDDATLAFEKPEDIADTEVIGTVMATDANSDDLTFEITTNTEDNLFVINDLGEIRLAAGKNLDYENAQQLIIEITVNDGALTDTATVTITVTNVIETLAEDPASFVTGWNIGLDDVGIEVGMGINPDYEYNYTIDWGDGTVETNVTTAPTHTYAAEGPYTVAIKGNFPAIVMYLESNVSKSSLASIEQWGTTVWQSFELAFAGCYGLLEINAQDRPILTQVENMWAMFYGDSEINEYGTIGSWDVSNVTNMARMFYNNANFNENLENWNVGKVTEMASMFENAELFTGDGIAQWDVSLVENMEGMFTNAINFDQSLENWVISNVSNMTDMFNGSGLSTENYSSTLLGWSTRPLNNDGVTLGAVDIDYCFDEAMSVARSYFIANFWFLDDGNAVACN